MKTIKEQADELVNLFRPYADNSTVSNSGGIFELNDNAEEINAINCAIICQERVVNEYQKIFRQITGGNSGFHDFIIMNLHQSQNILTELKSRI